MRLPRSGAGATCPLSQRAAHLQALMEHPHTKSKKTVATQYLVC